MGLRMPTANDLITLEDSWVGTTENPLGSNETWIGAEFGWNGVAWCAETQSVALNRVFGRKLFWSASVAEWIGAAKSGTNGLWWVPKDGHIEAGWLVTYDFGGNGNPSEFHIAMVRDPSIQTKFQTDGGNEGDAVRQQWRDRTYVQGFIGIPYDKPVSTTILEDDLVFITEFNDWPGKLWLVLPWPTPGGVFGWRKWIPNPDFFWDLASLGVKVHQGPVNGGGLYTEVK